MREIFDYRDAADPWAVIAVIGWLMWVLEAIAHKFCHRVHRRWVRAHREVARVACAHERIQGYAHGYKDGHAGQMPAYRAAEDQVVPAAFTRESYRT